MIKEYTITDTGKSNGLDIPTGFKINVINSGVYYIEDTYYLILDVCTMNGTIEIQVNDDLPNRYQEEITQSEARSTTMNSLLNNKYKVYLETIYATVS